MMRRAIFLAKKAINPSPNPRVGAVVWNRGRIVGEGFHTKAGEPHAEILALRKAGKFARGGKLFVTLEPCNHFGRTPPCSREILKAGISRVVFGVEDKTKSSGGTKFLMKNGVEVLGGILEKECREAAKIWFKNVNEKMPFVTLKMALDERGSSISTRGRKWISSRKSRREVMKMRRGFDAIAVGVGTILADDPRLTIRGLKIEKQPTRIIFDPDERTPKTAKIYKNSGETILILRKDFPNYDLRKILRALFECRIRSIFLEGGLTTARKFLEKKLVDELFIFQKNAKSKTKIWEKNRLAKIDNFDDDTLFWRKLK